MPKTKELTIKQKKIFSTLKGPNQSLNNEEFIKALNDAEPGDVNVPDENGDTPLHIAYLLRNKVWIDILENFYNANVIARNNRNMLPLEMWWYSNMIEKISRKASAMMAPRR